MDSRYKKLRGNQCEQIALNHLGKNNYKILSTNYRSRFGEIDIIALQEKEIVFVEVRSKWHDSDNNIYNSLVTPEETVNYTKLRKIEKTAEDFLLKKEKIWKSYFPEIINTFPNWRIDLIAIEVNKATKKARLKHYKYLYI